MGGGDKVVRITDKQENFVRELIKGRSQREAYKNSYNCKKMNDKTIDENASRLFANSKVRARYNQLHDRLIKEAEDECIVEAKQVLREIARIAFSSGADYAQVVSDTDSKQHVKLVDTASLPEDKRSAIASIKRTKHGISVESYDKLKALEILGKHLGIFKDQIEVSGNVNNPFEALTTEELRELIK